LSSDTAEESSRAQAGAFLVRFRAEHDARTAARDASGAGFAVDIRHDGGRGWLVTCRRRAPFPADEQRRYAGRLQALAAKHRGAYDHFVAD
jgi:hypothetical protein